MVAPGVDPTDIRNVLGNYALDAMKKGAPIREQLERDAMASNDQSGKTRPPPAARFMKYAEHLKKRMAERKAQKAEKAGPDSNSKRAGVRTNSKRTTKSTVGPRSNRPRPP